MPTSWMFVGAVLAIVGILISLSALVGVPQS